MFNKLFDRRTKLGFTIVELVIVIAVIAILAAVLIPTFSGITKKANLSADKQAVREMNMALAADEPLNGKPQNIDRVMQILANAGYNSENWVCLTKGYEVYWYKADNRLILYNASEAAVEYPEEYSADLMTAHNKEGFYLYNENHMHAQNFPSDLGSSDGASAQGMGDLIANAGNKGDTSLKGKLEDLQGALNNSELKDVIPGAGSDVHIFGQTEHKSSETAKAHASIIISSAAKGDKPVIKDNGTNELKSNLFYVSVEKQEGATAEEIAAAETAAGDYIYNVFDQVTTGKLDPDISIVIAPGTVIKNAPDKEWAPAKTFTGYFGTSDPENPIIIDGINLSKQTGFSQTVSFDGSSSKYYVTGFFGTVYGNTTIENVVFKNITIKEAGSDFWINNHDYKVNGKVADSRSTFGIIGGITNKNGNDSLEANVTIRNVRVENSVTIDCDSSGAGLVGYIGAAASSSKLTGNILIDNCTVSANVLSTKYQQSSITGYGPIGGVVGFLCRANGVNMTIQNTKFNGEVKGNNASGGLIGNVQGFNSITLTNNDLTDAKVTCSGSHGNAGYLVGAMGSEFIAKITQSGNKLPTGAVAYTTSEKSDTDGIALKYDITGTPMNPKK